MFELARRWLAHPRQLVVFPFSRSPTTPASPFWQCYYDGVVPDDLTEWEEYWCENYLDRTPRVHDSAATLHDIHEEVKIW